MLLRPNISRSFFEQQEKVEKGQYDNFPLNNHGIHI